MTTPPDDPRADEGLVEAVDIAAADDLYGDLETHLQDYEVKAMRVAFARHRIAALTAARSHGGM